MPDRKRREPTEKEAMQEIVLMMTGLEDNVRRRLGGVGNFIQNEQGWQLRNEEKWYIVCQSSWPAPGTYFLRTKKLDVACRALAWVSNGRKAPCPYDLPDEEWLPQPTPAPVVVEVPFKQPPPSPQSAIIAEKYQTSRVAKPQLVQEQGLSEQDLQEMADESKAHLSRLGRIDAILEEPVKKGWRP